MNPTHISVIIPVYGCCNNLKLLCERLVKTLNHLSQEYEIIMINDASPDNSWGMIHSIAQHNPRIKGLNLSRNFGQHHAITAGLDFANGDWVVVMDCDLQDPPEEIIKLYNKAQEGYDIVFGRRVLRKDSFLKKLGSKVYFKILNYFTESNVDNRIANFSIISSGVLNQLRKLKEQNRSYPLFINWLGFEKTVIDIEHDARESGNSSYTLKKLITLAIDNIISQSNKPLRLSIKFGFLLAFASLSYSIFLVTRYFVQGTPVEGWTSVIVSIYFIGGLLFANMGVLGLYIGKVFDQAKNRPLYIIGQTINIEDKHSG